MATIPCPQCDKTFRGESGLNWHLERTHRQAPGFDQMGGKTTAVGVHDDLHAKVNVLQERIDAIAEAPKDIAGKLRSQDAIDAQIRALKAGLSVATEDIICIRDQVEAMKTGLRDTSGKSHRQEPTRCIGVRHAPLNCSAVRRPPQRSHGR